MSETVKGNRPQTSTNSQANALNFFVESLVKGLVNTAIPVRVESVEAGGVGKTGYLSATPLVQMYDGFGNALPATTIPRLPYARIQGGVAALIIDPIPGDIGIAVFAQQDISNVEGGQPTKPPSFRCYNMADGMYIGGILNQIPSIYLELTQEGEATLVAPKSLTIISPKVDIQGLVTVTQDVMTSGISLKSHVHNGVTPGGGTTGSPQ